MRTKSTKDFEKLSFERLSTWSIIIGANKVLTKRAFRFYKRHEAGFLYLALSCTYFVVGLQISK